MALSRKGGLRLKHSRIFREFFTVGGVILVAKLAGFIKQMVTASVFGATIETDLINLSENFVGDLQYVLVQVLLTSFTTVYLHTREKGETQAKSFAMDVIRAFSIIALGLSAAVLLAAPFVARIIAPSYSPALAARLTGYLRLFSPVLVLFVWIAVFHALLNANRRFIPGELIGFNQSIIVIVLVCSLQKHFGVQTLALAFFIYHIWNTLYLGILSRQYWSRSQGNPFQNESVKQLLWMAGPLLLGYSMVYVNQQVDKILSSSLEHGTVTALGYAAVLSNLVGTFIGSFCSILFTDITARIARADHTGAAALASRAASLLLLIFLPISILTVLCAEDVISIVFARGAFDAAAVRSAAHALRGYALSFVPLVLRDLFSRFHYGYQDSRHPMVNSSLGITANIALSIALCPRFGVFGITFASSVSVLLCGILNMLTARRHNKTLSFLPLLKQLPWLLAGGVLCLLAAQRGIALLVNVPPIIRFPLVTLMGFCAYLPAAIPTLWKFLRKETTA